MKTVRFHAAADAEMIEAAAYYETQQKRLGQRFLASVQEALNRIRINPLLYPKVVSDVHRCLTKTFPFGILFRSLPDTIIVVAVMHLHRQPDYWTDRIEGLD